MECNVLEAETPLQNDGEISTPYLTISIFKICFVDDDGRGIHHEHVFTIEDQTDALLFRLRWPPDWLWHPLWLPCSRTG